MPDMEDKNKWIVCGTVVALIIILFFVMTTKSKLVGARSTTYVPSLIRSSFGPKKKCNCKPGECSCSRDKAKLYLDRIKDMKKAKAIGGRGLVQKIRFGNKKAEKELKNNLVVGEDTPGGDYGEYITNQNINPEVKSLHREYLSERKMFSQQPAIPSDHIEANYGNFHGFGRRSVRVPAPDALQQWGAKNEDYEPNWKFNFG